MPCTIQCNHIICHHTRGQIAVRRWRPTWISTSSPTLLPSSSSWSRSGHDPTASMRGLVTTNGSRLSHRASQCRGRTRMRKKTLTCPIVARKNQDPAHQSLPPPLLPHSPTTPARPLRRAPHSQHPHTPLACSPATPNTTFNFRAYVIFRSEGRHLSRWKSPIRFCQPPPRP